MQHLVFEGVLGQCDYSDTWYLKDKVWARKGLEFIITPINTRSIFDRLVT